MTIASCHSWQKDILAGVVLVLRLAVLLLGGYGVLRLILHEGGTTAAA
jgi:hypothetical protein